MNKAVIIGNLTKDPELRSTQNGIAVCTFTVAVNRKNGPDAGQQEADYFKVTAWRQLGEVCQRYLAKGRKVAVVGDIRLERFTRNDGTQGANMEVTANDVEFLSPAGSPQQAQDKAQGFIQADDEELPF